MGEDRAARQLVAAFFFVAAALLASSALINRAPLLEWWQPAVLTILGLAALSLRLRRTAFDEADDTPAAAPEPAVREYLPPPAAAPAISASAEAAPIPFDDSAPAANPQG